MAETIRVLVPEEKVDERIRELGEQISRDYEGKQVHLICVLKGGVFFMCELAKRITWRLTTAALRSRMSLSSGTGLIMPRNTGTFHISEWWKAWNREEYRFWIITGNTGASMCLRS